MKRTRPAHKDPDLLTCPACGYSDRFIQVMFETANIVNGRRNHIRLLEGVVDHYLCWKCGTTFEDDV
jgi:DNA-directed RNA polymerase subunit RPC12/RpoP